MTRGGKIALICVLATATLTMILIVGSGLLLAASVARGEVIRVQVHENVPHRTVDISVPFPAALANVAIDLAALAVPREEYRWPRHQRDWRPALAAACRALEDSPDAVLVKVEDGLDRIEVAKHGQTLVVDVWSPASTVHVSLPAHLLSHLARIAT
ncbi:MAG TPA: hypothetical protein VHQ90_15950 [Thermoanaerobaculia bacterium]|nr:hypothetical protein [Thermoanaerobaculia bacterium]